MALTKKKGIVSEWLWNGKKKPDFQARPTSDLLVDQKTHQPPTRAQEYRKISVKRGWYSVCVGGCYLPMKPTKTRTFFSLFDIAILGCLALPVGCAAPHDDAVATDTGHLNSADDDLSGEWFAKDGLYATITFTDPVKSADGWSTTYDFEALARYASLPVRGTAVVRGSDLSDVTLDGTNSAASQVELLDWSATLTDGALDVEMRRASSSVHPHMTFHKRASSFQPSAFPTGHRDLTVPCTTEAYKGSRPSSYDRCHVDRMSTESFDADIGLIFGPDTAVQVASTKLGVNRAPYFESPTETVGPLPVDSAGRAQRGNFTLWLGGADSRIFYTRTEVVQEDSNGCPDSFTVIRCEGSL
jgi:hypothetical protein